MAGITVPEISSKVARAKSTTSGVAPFLNIFEADSAKLMMELPPSRGGTARSFNPCINNMLSSLWHSAPAGHSFSPCAAPQKKAKYGTRSIMITIQYSVTQ